VWDNAALKHQSVDTWSTTGCSVNMAGLAKNKKCLEGNIFYCSKFYV
jgi:hypothetical protein